MERYLIIMLSLCMFLSPYCVVAGAMEREHHKTHSHQHREKGSPVLSGRLEDGVRVIELKASRYKFEPDPIVVKLGEKVRLVAASADVSHGIAIPEFKVNLSIPVGKTQSVEFVANKKGAFHAHCSVYCGPGHGHMHGNFIVE